MEKKKRIVTKIGNVFCVEIENQYKCYFQYIANDLTQLNSSVIRVFKKKHPMENNPSMEEIVNDEVYFYAHVILRIGILYEAWYKVGTSKNLGDTENIMFRWYNENAKYMTKSSRWFVWQINNPFISVGNMTEKYTNYNIGVVFTYSDIISKIATGKFEVKILD